MSAIPHSRTWWLIKNLCGLALIAAMVARYVYAVPAQINVAIKLGQLVVLIGAFASIWHYYLLKKINSKLETPEQLLTHTGLFSLVRHPMYLFDCVAYTGLFLLGGQFLMLPVLGLGYLALVKQSEVEDANLAARFPQDHQAWTVKTKLLIPSLY